MRLMRTSLPTVAIAAAGAALVSGLVLSAVDARHHKSSSLPPPSETQTISIQMQQALAHQLRTMKLPSGIRHTDVCPRVSSPADACFAGTLTVPVASPVDAVDVVSGMLKSLDVVPGTTFSCPPVIGGPQGSGYSCSVDGTWNSAEVSATVFISNPGHRPAGIPAVDAMLSVLSVRP